MLRGLSIANVLLIRELDLEFESGLNVLTGETGAGKSILLDALGFVLGLHGRAEIASFDARDGEISASFELPGSHPVRELLTERGFAGGDELVLRRKATATGRRSAFVNERRCSSAALREIGASLVEFHGQNDDRGLLNPSNHKKFLDDFAGASDILAICAGAWNDRKAARAELDKAKSMLEDSRSEVEYLEHAVASLKQLNPRHGEEEELDSRRRIMKNSAKIMEYVAKAENSIGESGAEAMIDQARSWLEDASTHSNGRLNEIVSALERAFSELGEAQQGLQEFRASLEFDQYELEAVEERLFDIRAAARKHRVATVDLPDLVQRLESDLDRLKAGETKIDELTRKFSAADENYEAAAARLSKTRRRAAAKLDKAMSKELAPVKLDKAKFSTEIGEGSRGVDGRDRIQFHATTNPGTPPGPINRIASGGELSRFILSLKVCLASGGGEGCMIFDEIDRGVGGATADAIGRRLKSLAENSQVLVVTHSPQVAAFGDFHWRVEKSSGKSESTTRVVGLGKEERVREIARMLAGDEITAEAVAAAKSLLTRA